MLFGVWNDKNLLKQQIGEKIISHDKKISRTIINKESKKKLCWP